MQYFPLRASAQLHCTPGKVTPVKLENEAWPEGAPITDVPLERIVGHCLLLLTA